MYTTVNVKEIVYNKKIVYSSNQLIPVMGATNLVNSAFTTTSSTLTRNQTTVQLLTVYCFSRSKPQWFIGDDWNAVFGTVTINDSYSSDNVVSDDQKNKGVKRWRCDVYINNIADWGRFETGTIWASAFGKQTVRSAKFTVYIQPNDVPTLTSTPTTTPYRYIRVNNTNISNTVYDNSHLSTVGISGGVDGTLAFGNVTSSYSGVVFSITAAGILSARANAATDVGANSVIPSIQVIRTKNNHTVVNEIAIPGILRYVQPYITLSRNYIWYDISGDGYGNITGNNVLPYTKNSGSAPTGVSLSDSAQWSSFTFSTTQISFVFSNTGIGQMLPERSITMRVYNAAEQYSNTVTFTSTRIKSLGSLGADGSTGKSISLYNSKIYRRRITSVLSDRAVISQTTGRKLSTTNGIRSYSRLRIVPLSSIASQTSVTYIGINLTGDIAPLADAAGMDGVSSVFRTNENDIYIYQRMITGTKYLTLDEYTPRSTATASATLSALSPISNITFNTISGLWIGVMDVSTNGYRYFQPIDSSKMALVRRYAVSC